MRSTCNCAADQRLHVCLPYNDNTSVSDPEDRFFATQLLFNYNYKQPLQEGLSACNQCVERAKLGWVKAINRLTECNHGCFYFQLYLVQKETQCFDLQFLGLKIIDFKNCFNSVVLPSNKDIDCIVSS